MSLPVSLLHLHNSRSLPVEENVQPFLANENDDRNKYGSADAAGQERPTIRRKSVPGSSKVPQEANGSNLGGISKQQGSVHEAEPSSLQDSLPYTYDGDPWFPGFWMQFPYQGVLSLCGCLACIVASVAVLVVSEGQPTSSWKVSPTVYLAGLMTVTNMLARFAFKEGAKIAWWSKALRGGTLGDLHHRWAHADAILPAIFSGREFNLVTLGSIAITVLVIDQPLIQRASSVVTVSRVFPVNVTAPIAPEIPWGFTAYEAGRFTVQQLMTQPMISAFNDFNSQTPIKTDFSGCQGTCTGYVMAGGLAAHCNATSGPVEYGSIQSVTGTVVTPFGVTFNISAAGVNASQSSYITMSVVYSNKSDYNCSATLTKRICILAPATFKYPITLVGNVLRIGDMLNNGTIQSFQPSPFSANLSHTLDDSEYSWWTIGGLYLAAVNLFSSNATYTAGGGIGIYATLPDTLSNQFLEPPAQILSGLQGPWNLTINSGCVLNWTDPTSYILSSLNAIAFRVSLNASSFPYRNTSTPPNAQVVTMTDTRNVNVFRSEYRFLIASTLLATACTMLIAPTFIGWWTLGRPVSLNPIEIGKAFDAPLLQGPGSNAQLSKLVRIMEGRRVQWGEVEDYSTQVTSKLKLADPAEVMKPKARIAYT